MLQFLLMFLIGLGASIVGAISGIGGGIIIKPVLDATTDLGVAVIGFVSGLTVLSMAVVSLARRMRTSSAFEPRRGALLVAGSVAGGLLGTYVFGLLNRGGGGAVGTIQSACLLLMSAGLLVYLRFQDRLRRRNLQGAGVAALGFALGLISSFLGIGGGPMNLAALSYFLSMDNKRASLHSLFIILFSQTTSFVLTIARGAVPSFPWPLLVCAVAGGVMGGLVGSMLVRRMSDKAVGRLYACLLVFLTLLSGYNLVMYAVRG